MRFACSRSRCCPKECEINALSSLASPSGGTADVYDQTVEQLTHSVGEAFASGGGSPRTYSRPVEEQRQALIPAGGSHAEYQCLLTDDLMLRLKTAPFGLDWPPSLCAEFIHNAISGVSAQPHQIREFTSTGGAKTRRMGFPGITACVPPLKARTSLSFWRS